MPSSDLSLKRPINPLRRESTVSAALTFRLRKLSRVWLYTQYVFLSILPPTTALSGYRAFSSYPSPQTLEAIMQSLSGSDDQKGLNSHYVHGTHPMYVRDVARHAA